MRSVTVAVLLTFSLGVNMPVNTLQGSPELQKLRALPPEETSGSVPQDSLPQSDPHTSPSNALKLALTDGTPVHLCFVRAVVSSQVIAGEKVPLEVVEPVLAGNLVVIPQHSYAEAVVTMAQAKRGMGRGGNLQMQIESVRLADGELAPVRAVKDVKGQARQVILAGMVSTFLFNVKGKNATIAAGAAITAFIAGDFPLDASKFQTADMSIQEKSAPR